MLIWDEAKRAANIAKHGVDFAAADAFDWQNALTWIDKRFDYSEVRQIALGRIDQRLHVLIYTRRGADVRVVSLRKANPREERHYAKASQT